MQTPTIPSTRAAAQEASAPQGTVREQVQLLLAGGYTQAQIGAESGLNKSVISLWLAGKYPGDNAKVETGLANWLASREGQDALPPDPGYYWTPTSQRILDVMRYTQMRGSLGLVYGGAGVCKSSSKREYQRRHPNIWTIISSPATSRPTATMGEICVALAEGTLSQRPAALEKAIVDKITGTRGLIVVDDAQYLPVDTLYQLAWIREKSGCGIVLLGNEETYGRMRAGYAQLSSRIGKRLKLNLPCEGDLDACLAAWEQHRDLDEGTLAQHRAFFLGTPEKRGPARLNGGLRNVTECLALAFFLAHGAGQPIGLAHLKAAWRDLSDTATAA